MRRLTVALFIVLIFGVSELTARATVHPIPHPGVERLEDWWRFIAVDATDGASFHSADYNIDSGIRRTVGVPEYAPRTVWLLGSSLAFDILVTDRDTIASQLQARLSNRYRVVNLGMTNEIPRVTWQRLRRIPVAAGDVVIFYHGASSAQTIYGAAIRRHQETYAGCLWFHEHLSQLALVERGCNAALWGNPDLGDLEAQAAQVASDYANAVQEARAYTESHGARFIAVIEPALYSREIAPHERWILDYDLLTAPGLDAVYAVLWPILRRVPGTVDFTHLLDEAREERLLYGDATHLNAAGDRLIAAAFYDLIG